MRTVAYCGKRVLSASNNCAPLAKADVSEIVMRFIGVERFLLVRLTNSELQSISKDKRATEESSHELSKRNILHSCSIQIFEYMRMNE
jgi:hypothetical protein